MTTNPSFSDVEIPVLQDKRSGGMREIPFSAYCKVCWFPTYLHWNPARDGPPGACIHACTEAHQCPEALNRTRSVADVARLYDAGLLPRGRLVYGPVPRPTSSEGSQT